MYGEDFVFYDYNKPLDVPTSLGKGSFDLVVADPPFLSEECLQKTAETIRHLAKDKILLCTGEYMHRDCSRPGHLSGLINETTFSMEMVGSCI